MYTSQTGRRARRRASDNGRPLCGGPVILLRMNNIRAKSVCLVRNGTKILLAEGFDPAKNERYVMPVGGGIEFMEPANEAAAREMFEEIGVRVRNLHLLGVSENRFNYNGSDSHEIVFVFAAEFEDEAHYQVAQFQGTESNDESFVVRWYDESELKAGAIPFYPDGIVAMI